MKLDLGGIGKGKDALTVNIYEPCDIKHDLNIFPYPLNDNTYNHIDCIAVLEHLNDPIKTMCEIHRVAKDGAMVYIEVPYHKRDTAMTIPPHKHEMKPDWFRAWDNTTQWGKHFSKEHWTSPQFRIIRIRKTGSMGRIFRRIPKLVRFYTTRTAIKMKVVKIGNENYRVR